MRRSVLTLGRARIASNVYRPYLRYASSNSRISASRCIDNFSTELLNINVLNRKHFSTSMVCSSILSQCDDDPSPGRFLFQLGQRTLQRFCSGKHDSLVLVQNEILKILQFFAPFLDPESSKHSWMPNENFSQSLPFRQNLFRDLFRRVNCQN